MQVEHFSKRFPGMTVEDAYAVQRAWVAKKIADGRKPIGHKIGLTSRAMQRSSNITEPDYGTLLDDMLFPDGQDIPIERFIVPRVEVELAFILKDRLQGPNCTIFDVLSATDYIVPAIEIIDARIQQVDPATGVTRKVFDTISDNAANAGIVLGGRPVKPMDVDLRWVSALLYRNGVDRGFGASPRPSSTIPPTAPPGSPTSSRPMARRWRPARSFWAAASPRPSRLARGDSFHVDYGPLALHLGCEALRMNRQS